MNAAIYLRVSSTDGRQDEAHQEPECRRICEARGWILGEKNVFRERESGAKKRPIWEACLEQARRGSVGAIVVFAIDRIGRDRVKVAHDLGKILAWNCRIVSVHDAWLDSPDSAVRPLLIQVLGWVAQQQRDRLIENTRSGQARARAAGVIFGRKRKVSEDVELMIANAYRRGGVVEARGVPGAEGVGASTLRMIARRYGVARIERPD